MARSILKSCVRRPGAPFEHASFLCDSRLLPGTLRQRPVKEHQGGVQGLGCSWRRMLGQARAHGAPTPPVQTTLVYVRSLVPVSCERGTLVPVARHITESVMIDAISRLGDMPQIACLPLSEATSSPSQLMLILPAFLSCTCKGLLLFYFLKITENVQ